MKAVNLCQHFLTILFTQSTLRFKRKQTFATYTTLTITLKQNLKKSITLNLTSGKSNKKRFGTFVIQETNDGFKERNYFELLNPGD